MPVRSDKQRRAMGAALRGKSTLGIPKKVAKEFLGKADGGLTGSAGRAAPTIATSARHYADGGNVAQDALSKRVEAYKKQMAKTRKARASGRARKAKQATEKVAAVKGSAPSVRLAGSQPSRSTRTSRSQAASGPKRKTRGLKAVSATKPPSRPARVDVGRDGSVTTTRRSPAPSRARSQAASGPVRKTRTRPASSRSQAASGPKRKTRTRSGGNLLSRAVRRLTDMNKESVARARAHGNRD